MNIEMFLKQNLPSKELFLNEEYIDGLISKYEWTDHGATLDDFLDYFTEEDSFPVQLKETPFRELVALEPFKALFKEWLSKRYDYCVSTLIKEIPSFPLEINRTIPGRKRLPPALNRCSAAA